MLLMLIPSGKLLYLWIFLISNVSLQGVCKWWVKPQQSLAHIAAGQVVPPEQANLIRNLKKAYYPNMVDNAHGECKFAELLKEKCNHLCNSVSYD